MNDKIKFRIAQCQSIINDCNRLIEHNLNVEQNERVSQYYQGLIDGIKIVLEGE